jgi:MerR family copper efflux transcriptional regulator
MLTQTVSSAKSHKPLTIGVLAVRAGVGVETIRFYARKGLIVQPNRPPGAVRAYSESTVKRLEFVHQAQELGFTLREIGELIALQANPDSDCSEVKSRAAEKLAEVEGKMKCLANISRTLRQLVDVCPGEGELADCSIVAALSTAPAEVLTNHPDPLGNALMKSADLAIEGMHCQGCAKTVEMLLATVAGVKTASASFADHGAKVFYDPAAVTPQTLVAAIEQAGYKASVRT